MPAAAAQEGKKRRKYPSLRADSASGRGRASGLPRGTRGRRRANKKPRARAWKEEEVGSVVGTGRSAPSLGSRGAGQPRGEGTSNRHALTPRSPPKNILYLGHMCFSPSWRRPSWGAAIISFYAVSHICFGSPCRARGGHSHGGHTAGRSERVSRRRGVRAVGSFFLGFGGDFGCHGIMQHVEKGIWWVRMAGLVCVGGGWGALGRWLVTFSGQRPPMWCWGLGGVPFWKGSRARETLDNA